MFVNEGLKPLLDQQKAYFNELYWALFTDDTVIASTTVLADLGSEAAWSGYVHVGSAPWGTVSITDPRSVMQALTIPEFGNTSGSDQDFHVVALVDIGNGWLIWAQNIGLTTIPDGLTYSFSAQATDKQE